MKPIEVEVTEENANDGFPGEASCCAIAIAIKEKYYPDDDLHVEVQCDGSIDIRMDGEYEEDTGITSKVDLYTLYPVADQETEISNFIQDYDDTPADANYSELDYMNFPYNFKFFRPNDA